MIVLLGFVELLHIEIQRRDALRAVDLLLARGLGIDYALELVYCLFGHANILGTVNPGNVLAHKRGSEVQARIEQLRIEFHSLLEVVNGLFVMRVLVGLDTLVELIAGPQLIAALRGEERQRSRRQREQSYILIHCGISLLATAS